MFWRFFFLGFLFVVASCKTSESLSPQLESESIRERFDIDIQFASLEDVKRVPLRFNKLRMELRRELSEGQNIYLVSIECKPLSLNGVLEKLNADEGIVNAQIHQ